MCLVDSEAPIGGIEQAGEYSMQNTENCEPQLSYICFRLNCIELREYVPF